MKCSISNIANVISESIPNPAESGFDIFVGLEHYDSGEVKVTRYGSTQNLVTAVKVFRKGDILLARRNVYLKRAGLVDFDGVTSGDSIVLRVKDDLSSLSLQSEDIRMYLPFVLNTEEFWNYAEKYSDGTMSKRLSPKTLLQYEFDIPDDVTEKNRLLWQAYKTKESYKAMITATDEMVKSQFIEMFGDPITNSKGRKQKPFIEVVTLHRGYDLPEGKRVQSGSIPIYGANGFLGYHDCAMAKDGIVTGRSGAIGEVYEVPGPYWPLNTALFSIDTHGNNITYLTYLLRFFDIKRFGTGTGVPTLNRNDVHKEMIYDVELTEQSAFEKIAKQADKSKFDGLKSQFIEMFRTAPKEHVHLKDIATYSIGLTYKPENVKPSGIPVLRSGNIQEESLDFGDLVRVDSSIPDTLLLQDGDILMCSRNGSAHLVGKVARIRQLPEPMTYGAFMTVIRSEYMDYLFLFFQSDGFRQQISYGKSSTMNQITQKMLDQITLDLPSKTEIKKLSPLLEQADKSKFELKQAIEKIDKVMRALMQ